MGRMMNPPPAALQIQDVHKSFPSEFTRKRHPVLKGISLEVPKGEIFGYLGPNGAGKTTTLKCVLGLIFPDKGDIKILHFPHLSLNGKQKIGFLPENPYFYDYLSAEEFLRFYCQLHRIPGREQEPRIQRLLKLVGLESSGTVQLRKYSKGMLQRIGLAQALLNQPELVLLDEPLGGLDPLGRKEMRDIIGRLRDEGSTVFLSSHILQDIEMICDQVAVIVDGKIIRQGELKDLIRQKVLFTEATVSGISPEELKKFGEILHTRGDQTLVRIYGSQKIDDLMEWVYKNKGRIQALVPRHQSLEDIFVKMVK
jgi:ABC-2 type transport system ATP-binding protein